MTPKDRGARLYRKTVPGFCIIESLLFSFYHGIPLLLVFSIMISISGFAISTQVSSAFKGTIRVLDKLKVVWCPVLTLESPPIFEKPYTLKLCREKYECVRKRAAYDD